MFERGEGADNAIVRPVRLSTPSIQPVETDESPALASAASPMQQLAFGLFASRAQKLGEPVGFADLAAARRSRVQSAAVQAPTPVRPLSEILPYDRFIQLLQHTVRQIPDLDPLWSWQETTDTAGADEVYLQGGVLRGVLIWLHEQLQTKSPEEIESMPLASTEDLLTQLADRDLLSLALTEEQLEAEVPYVDEENYEVRSPLDQRNAVLMGGTTLEKAGVSPVSIIDPLDGLEHFWKGQLVYATGEWRSAPTQGYSLLDGALRHLRFVHDLWFLEVPPDSLERLQAVGPSEFGVNGRTAMSKHMIEKPLAKFLESVGRDVVRALDILRVSEFLPTISDGNYQFQRDVLDPSTGAQHLPRLVAKLVERGFDGTDLRQARRVLRLSAEEQVHFTRVAASLLGDDPEQVLELFETRPGADHGPYGRTLAAAFSPEDFGGAGWTDAHRERLGGLLTAASSAEFFFRDAFEQNEVAAMSTTQIALGITMPERGDYGAVTRHELITTTRELLDALATRPEDEKTALADLLFDVLAYEVDFDVSSNSDELAMLLFSKLDPKSESVQMRMFEEAKDGSNRTEMLDVLAKLSAPCHALKEAVAAEVHDQIDPPPKPPPPVRSGKKRRTRKKPRERPIPTVDVRMAQLAAAYGVGDEARTYLVTGLERELDRTPPNHLNLARLFGPLGAFDDAPAELVERYFEMAEAHVLSGGIEDDSDRLVGGTQVFIRTADRADLARRLGGLVEKAWAADVPMDGLLHAWARALKDLSDAAPKEEARDTLLARLADETIPIDTTCFHAWAYWGPKDVTLDIDWPTYFRALREGDPRDLARGHQSAARELVQPKVLDQEHIDYLNGVIATELEGAPFEPILDHLLSQRLFQTRENLELLDAYFARTGVDSGPIWKLAERIRWRFED